MWEDTPNESSDIQLLSMKAIEESEFKDGEEQKDGGVLEDKEAGKEGSDKKEEVNKEDDITVGTFGFAEKVTESKAESPTTVIESEKKEDQSKKDETAKKDKNENVVEVTIEKAGEHTAGMGLGENPAPVSPCRGALFMYACYSNNLFCRMHVQLLFQLRKKRYHSGM